MLNPKLTGISGITGRIVYIRHATDWDVIMIAKRLGYEARFAADNAVVAVEEDRIIGFAILDKLEAMPGNREAGCVTIFEDNRRRGIGASIVRHLLEYRPVKTIYASSDRSGYFKRAGFTKAKRVPAGSRQDTVGLCRWPAKHGVAIMKYERADSMTA